MSGPFSSMNTQALRSWVTRVALRSAVVALDAVAGAIRPAKKRAAARDMADLLVLTFLVGALTVLFAESVIWFFWFSEGGSGRS